MPKKSLILTLASVFCLYVFLLSALAAMAAPALPAREEPVRQHLVFFRGTPQELDVYKARGRQDGPTVMLLGGIHGDESGAYASADLYADLVPRRGNLIVVPRANFQAVLQGRRGPGGDMNRKFGEIKDGDPEGPVVAVLKSLMAESDLLLTLHDGSGFYRPEWESEQANPKRYGQCVIADTARYAHPGSGKTLELEKQARAVIARVNAEIAEPLHRFRFFNMETAGDESLYKEHRDSATYFALTRLGRPAFCIETSKSLPNPEAKIRQHNLAINAFLELYGVELEAPGLEAAAPEFSHLVIRLRGPGGELPLALADGQTLLVKPGESLEVLHAGASVQRGLLVAVDGGFASAMNRPLRVDKHFSLTVRRDSRTLGQVNIGLLADTDAASPQVSGKPATRYAAFTRAGADASLDQLPGFHLLAELDPAEAGTQADALARAGKPGKIAGFLVEVDGQPYEIKPGEELPVLHGSRLKLVDIRSEGGPLPDDVVMNLKGFVSSRNEARNTGEDRGATANISKNMLRGHSEGAKGEVYAINAEQGKTILASCSIRLIQPVLESVTVRIDGQTLSLRPADQTRRTAIAAGAKVELLAVTLRGGHKLSKPNYTLAGHQVPADLPQTLIMREIAINLAVFNNDALAGKVTWTPRRDFHFSRDSDQ